jgi:hypothetical protein
MTSSRSCPTRLYGKAFVAWSENDLVVMSPSSLTAGLNGHDNALKLGTADVTLSDCVHGAGFTGRLRSAPPTRALPIQYSTLNEEAMKSRLEISAKS